MDPKTLYSRKWRVVPCPDNPKVARLLTSRGREICKITFPKKPETACLKLIDQAPILQYLAEYQLFRMQLRREIYSPWFKIYTWVVEEIEAAGQANQSIPFRQS